MISLILTLGLIGFLAYLITTYIPMPPIFKTVIYVIIAIFAILFLMGALGIGDVAVPQLGN